jgi:hypothetical protein
MSDNVVTSSCRVDPGGYPPRSPTDPDVQISRIRLLVMRVRYARQAER